MRPTSRIVPGSFFGGEIEPGVFHLVNSDHRPRPYIPSMEALPVEASCLIGPGLATGSSVTPVPGPQVPEIESLEANLA